MTLMTCDNAEGWESSGGSASSGLHLRNLWIGPARDANPLMTCDNAEGWESSGGSASSGLHLRHLWIDPANEADREFLGPEHRIQGAGAERRSGQLAEVNLRSATS